jgi:hypothetical protein
MAFEPAGKLFEGLSIHFSKSESTMSSDTTQTNEDPVQSQGEATTAEKKPPEPWTPEKVVEWNRYYNLYVAAGLLVLAFVTSISLLEDSSIWASLRSGLYTVSNGFPATKDPFSYTVEGSRWINLGWAYETASYVVYGLGATFAPADKTEQYGASAVTILHAIVRLATFFVLLGIGTTRQGLWGRCVLLGAVVYLSIYKRIGSGLVGPELWGLLFLAIQLKLMFLVTDGKKTKAAWALPVLFAVWVNFAPTAGFGLLILLAWLAGLFLSGHKLNPPLSGKSLVVPVVASILACLVNPWTIFGFTALFRLTNQYTLIPGNPLGAISLPDIISTEFLSLLALLAVIGAVSFWLNSDRFRLDRFLPFVLATLAWAVWYRFAGEFTIVLAVLVGLNLEEWFVDSFGEKGHLGWKWVAFSIGGRGLTICGLFGLAVVHITGYGLPLASPTFGLGFDPDRFAFESASFLQTAELKGQVFNWNASQGDAMLWKAFPARKTYIDNRRNLFGEQLFAEREKLRVALRDDDKETWKPILDKYGITTVMVQAMNTFTEREARQTLSRLSTSPNWIQFYDDGSVAIYGRADAQGEDLAFFKSRILDADRIAYRQEERMPEFDRPPAFTSALDQVIASKSMALVQPHSQAALRWLIPSGVTTDPATPRIPTPAQAIAAVREARRAIAVKPDQSQGYRILADAYRSLHLQELALMAGIALTPENVQQIASLQAGPNPLGLRFRQRVAALHFAIETTSRNPSVNEERIYLASMHAEMAQLMLLANFVDLARDHLRSSLDLDPEAATAAERRAQLAQFNQALEQMETELSSMSLEEQANPMVRINRALSLGMVNSALPDLRDAERTGSSPDVILPILIDLYCQMGMPDQAITFVSNVGTSGMEPSAGISKYRQGLVLALLGDYAGAMYGWGNESIPVARMDEMRRGLMAGQLWLSGEVGTATRTFMELPDQLRAVAVRQFELGLIQLESGAPAAAADSFTNSLTREPESEFGAISRYYLEKLGKPVPEVKKPEAGAASSPAAPGLSQPPPAAASTDAAKPAAAETKKP